MVFAYLLHYRRCAVAIEVSVALVDVGCPNGSATRDVQRVADLNIVRQVKLDHFWDSGISNVKETVPNHKSVRCVDAEIYGGVTEIGGVHLDQPGGGHSRGEIQVVPLFDCRKKEEIFGTLCCNVC